MKTSNNIYVVELKNPHNPNEIWFRTTGYKIDDLLRIVNEKLMTNDAQLGEVLLKNYKGKKTPFSRSTLSRLIHQPNNVSAFVRSILSVERRPYPLQSPSP